MKSGVPLKQDWIFCVVSVMPLLITFDHSLILSQCQQRFECETFRVFQGKHQASLERCDRRSSARDLLLCSWFHLSSYSLITGEMAIPTVFPGTVEIKAFWLKVVAIIHSFAKEPYTIFPCSAY